MLVEITLLAVEAMSPPDTSPLALLFAVSLALSHFVASKLPFLQSIPRSRWLSLAAGVSVAYVFIHIFPELQEHQTVIEQTEGTVVEFFEHHLYLVALLGFALFYGLERLAIVSRRQNRKQRKDDSTTTRVFWLHTVSFSIYNVLIGYLLVHREEPGLLNMFFFFTAMALHFIVNDFALLEHHKHDYDRMGRWILIAAVISGWAIGRMSEVPEHVVAVFFAFIAGGIILNVLKEELPEERDSRFWAFALGALGYTILLLAL